MKQKRPFWGRMLSVFLALALFMSGLATPVQAGELTGLQDIPEENAAPEPEEETPGNTEEAVPLQEQTSVYFQYDDGRTQLMAEDNSFTLSAVDSGRFVLEGTDKTPDWNFSGKLSSDGGDSYKTHYWVGNDGRYCPADIRDVEGYVCNKNNKGEIFQSFKIKNVASNIEELKVFVGEQEVSLEQPFPMAVQKLV